LKPKCLNAKPIPFCPLNFELDLTFELCPLTLFMIWNLAKGIATPRLVGARNDRGGAEKKS
jgi:hypothetical protein